MERNNIKKTIVLKTQYLVFIFIYGYNILCMSALQEIELPKVKGNPVDQLPENLYVPPKALLLLLDVFSGPMDFLLYLIQRKNLDILEVNIVEITDQYIAYIELMDDFEY